MLAANDIGMGVEILDTEWPRSQDVLSVHEISLIL
jgi:hypothetical protein